MEDVMKVFYFLFFYFFLQSINKEIESLAQTQIFKPLEPDVVWYSGTTERAIKWYLKIYT